MAGNADISVELLRCAGTEFKKLLDDVKLGEEVRGFTVRMAVSYIWTN